MFDIGGNKFRLVTVIDYVHHRVYIRNVLTHADYDRNAWKADPGPRLPPRSGVGREDKSHKDKKGP